MSSWWWLASFAEGSSKLYNHPWQKLFFWRNFKRKQITINSNHLNFLSSTCISLPSPAGLHGVVTSCYPWLQSFRTDLWHMNWMPGVYDLEGCREFRFEGIYILIMCLYCLFYVAPRHIQGWNMSIFRIGWLDMAISSIKRYVCKSMQVVELGDYSPDSDHDSA